MSRSTWAAGASVFAFALIPFAALAAGPGSAAVRPASAHARQDPQSVAIVDGIVGVPTPALAPRGRPAAGHAAARPAASRHVSVLLALGSGYQQPAGLGRVRVLQRRLAGLGFAPGPIDGRYGPLTERAVRRFQTADGLRVDGIAGPQTITHLDPNRTVHPRTRASTHLRSRARSVRPSARSRPPASAQAPNSVGHPHASGSRSTWPALLATVLTGILVLLLLIAWFGEAGVRQRPSLGVMPEESDLGSAQAVVGRADQRGEDEGVGLARAGLPELHGRLQTQSEVSER
jgi:hypothetical protein